MSIVIKTKKTSNGSGAGVIVATSGKTQKTTKYDHAKSSNYNHGTAAANLLAHLDNKDEGLRSMSTVAALHMGNVRHTVTSDGGGEHKFEIL